MQSFRRDNLQLPRYLRHRTAGCQSIKGSYSFARPRLRYYCHAWVSWTAAAYVTAISSWRMRRSKTAASQPGAVCVCVWSTAVSMADANCRALLARREMQKRGDGATVKLLMLSVRRNHNVHTNVHDGHADRCSLGHCARVCVCVCGRPCPIVTVTVR